MANHYEWGQDYKTAGTIPYRSPDDCVSIDTIMECYEMGELLGCQFCNQNFQFNNLNSCILIVLHSANVIK